MVEEEDLKPGQPRLLATDNDVVVPVNKTVRVIVTASDGHPQLGRPVLRRSRWTAFRAG